MGMPTDLVLVRHGQSEGNVVNKRSKKGDDALFTPDFRKRHSSLWRLTDLGRKQAEVTGAWIREQIGTDFDRYYVSEYVRAMETAACLDLPSALWFTEFYLRERDWGDLDVMTEEDRHAKFADNLAKRESQPFFWTPPNGESMAELCIRMDRVLDTLHRECDGKRVIMVLHGETMWALRVRLERMSQERYVELDTSTDPCDHIHNCQVLHYSRRDPATGEVARALNWLRSSHPNDLPKSMDAWESIERRAYSNWDLKARVERVPRLIPE